jgi:hypothetical protein
MEVSSSLPRDAKISSTSIRELVELVGLGGALSCNIEQMRITIQFSNLIFFTGIRKQFEATVNCAKKYIKNTFYKQQE